jgi:hypothetical protein
MSGGALAALEVALLPWLGVRVIGGPSIDIAASGVGFAALSLNVGLGPLIRF